MIKSKKEKVNFLIGFGGMININLNTLMLELHRMTLNYLCMIQVQQLLKLE